MDERSSLGTVSKHGCFFWNARARNTHIEATLHHSCAAQVRGFGEWDARCCITGDYAEEDREPDSDLGKTHTPGFRNILTDAQKERTFGTPTVRSDIPKYAKRSIADHQNYGDDANAQELLYPSQLCAMGIDENEFFAKRPKADIWDLFTAIGWNLDDDKFHKLYDDVCDDDGMTNIETFRKILADKAL